jgi:small-conductance mechanosensitive channel
VLFSGSFRVGDRVKIGSVVGDVVESTLALTRLRTSKNELVTFSNGSVLNESFVNYSAMAREQGVILHTRITIGYDVPWREVHELLIQAALRIAFSAVVGAEAVPCSPWMWLRGRKLDPPSRPGRLTRTESPQSA